MSMQENGRVQIMTPDISTVFAMQDKIPANSSTDFRGAMTGNWYDTTLSNAFFSGENQSIIQNGIRAGVYNRSNGQYIIAPQSQDELIIIMRSIFLQYSQNLPSDLRSQIAKLNDLVLGYAVAQVYGEAEGYMKFKQDASTMYTPIAPPVMSKTNDKQLVLKKWF